MSGSLGLMSDPIGNVDQQAGGALFPSSAFQGQDWFGLDKQIGRAMERSNAEFGVSDPETGIQLAPPEPTISAEDANKQFGIPGHLTFSSPVPASVAQSMNDAKHDELARADAAARTPDGFFSHAARLGAGFVAGALDPLNLAAGLLPVVGEARVAGLVARTGLDGVAATLATRAGTGAISGAIGQAPLVALRYGLSQQEQADYTGADALADLLMGTALGSGLHVAAGFAGDLLGQRFGRSAAGVIAATDPEVREAAARTAVAQIASDRPVEVGPVLDAGEPGPPMAEPSATLPIFTNAGTRIDAKPEIAELDSLTASHTDDGRVNPDFPHDAGLQPRDRSNAAAQAQVRSMAGNLQPERLMPSADASVGAPIVGPDNVVESGNGRTMALRQVYADPALAAQRDAYQQALTAAGHDLTGFDKPVLISRRQTELDAGQRQRFTREANERSTLAMNAAEGARADADRAGRAIDLWRGASVGSAANRDFVRSFMAQLSPEERGGMMMPDGSLSADGERRIQGAVMAHAYGHDIGPVLDRFLNGDTENMRAIAGALSDAAGEWAKLRAAVARGEVPASLDITRDLGEAIQTVARARQLGRPVAELVRQTDLDRPPLSLAAEAILAGMFRDKAMRSPLGRDKMASRLLDYAMEAQRQKVGPDLFGNEPPGALEVLNATTRDEGAAQATFDQAMRSATEPLPAEPVSQLATEAGRTPEPKLTDIDQNRLADAAAFLRSAREADALPAGAEAEIARMDADTVRAENFGKALAQAGACLMRGVT